MRQFISVAKIIDMSTKYKFVDKQGVYFTTSTVVGWLDVFTTDLYKNITCRYRNEAMAMCLSFLCRAFTKAVIIKRTTTSNKKKGYWFFICNKKGYQKVLTTTVDSKKKVSDSKVGVSTDLLEC